MKKILFISALFTSALFLGSCNHESDFPGLDEATRVTALKNLSIDFTGAYPSAKTGGQYFTESVLASDSIPKWLSSKYYALDSASTIDVSYNYMTIGKDVNFKQNFDDASYKTANEAEGWYNITTSGANTWQYKTYNGNAYFQYSAYKEVGASVGWLISPRILVSEGMKFSFDACTGSYNADCLQILVSTDFNGVNLSKATWEDKSSSFSIPSTVKGYGTLGNVGSLDLSKYAGKSISIAFKYTGDGANQKTTTYQVDNITISKDVKLVTKNTDKFRFDGKKWNWVDPAKVYESINQTFEREGITAGKETAIDDWMNVAVQGSVSWLDKTFKSNNVTNAYTQFTAFGASGICDGWFITPKVRIIPNMKFSFDVNVGYYNANCLKVLISTDFKSKKDKISEATWEDITSNFIIPQEPASSYGTITSAGVMSLSKYEGKTVNIAFQYIGDGTASKTTTYQIDNIFVGVK
jgi:hypothetical protein